MSLQTEVTKLKKEPLVFLLPDEHPANQTDPTLDADIEKLWNKYKKTNDHNGTICVVAEKKKINDRDVYLLKKRPYSYSYIFQMSFNEEFRQKHPDISKRLGHIEYISANGILQSRKHWLIGQMNKKSETTKRGLFKKIVHFFRKKGKLSNLGGFLDLKHDQIPKLPDGIFDNDGKLDEKAFLQIVQEQDQKEADGLVKNPLRTSMLREGKEETGNQVKTNGPFCMIQLVKKNEQNEVVKVFENWVGYEVQPKRFKSMPLIVAQHKLFNAMQMIKRGEIEFSRLVHFKSLAELYKLSENSEKRQSVEPLAEELFSHKIGNNGNSNRSIKNGYQSLKEGIRRIPSSVLKVRRANRTMAR